MNFQPYVLALLEASLLRPLVLVAAAWLILRLLRVRHPASRHAVWTAVLAGMLVLPVLSVVTPDWTLRVLPWSQETGGLTPDALNTAAVAVEQPANAAVSPIVPSTETSGLSSGSAIGPPSLETLIVWGYGAGLFAMVSYRLIGWWLLRRVLSRSKSLRLACLRESEDVVTPVAVGLLRPSVILPAGWRAWSVATRRAVFAHEFAHLRRRDTLVAALARLVTCVFWFHPVAWWVSRQTSTLAELACDAVALQRVGDPAGYSRVLVEFARAVHRSGRRVALPGLAIASSSRMEERVDQVFELSGGTMRKLARPGVWLVATGLPALTLAATVVLSASAPMDTAGASARQVRPAAVEPAGAQATQSAVGKPRFEAATIKPCPPENTPASSGGARGTAGGTNASISPGRFNVPCVTTEQLIYLAYASYGARPEERLRNDDFGTASSAQKIRGGPDWVHSARDKYMIEAVAPGVTERTVLMGSMLQTLLEERFELTLHRESEEVAMFALTVGEGGFKLKPMKVDECDPTPGPPTEAPGAKPKCGNLKMLNSGGVIRWTFSGSPLSSLASMLSRSLGIHVIDRTNITDRFMMQFNFVVRDGTSVIRDAAGRDVTDAILSGPSVDEALDTQLGLKLDSIKAPRDYIVIDHIRRPSSHDGPGPASTGQTSAQVPASKFDAVSIKPCLQDALPPTGSSGRAAGPGSAATSPGRVHWTCVTLGELIGVAYAGPGNRLLHSRTGQRPGDPKPVRGGPSWVDSEKFAIEASAPSVAERATMIGPMLRAMLEDRFGLATHRETEERAMYALTVAKGGLKIKRTTSGDCNDDVDKERAQRLYDTGGLVPCGTLNMTWNGGNRKLTLTGVTLQHVAEAFLSDLVMDRFVVDQTRLEGRFNVQLEFAPDDSTPGGAAALKWARREGAEPPTAPSIFKALEEQLGLKLVSTKARAEYLVIDHVERPKPDQPASAEATAGQASR